MKLTCSELVIFMLFAFSSLCSCEFGSIDNNVVHVPNYKMVRKLQQVGVVAAPPTNICSQRIDPNSPMCFSTFMCGLKCKMSRPTYGGECKYGPHFMKRCYCNMPCGVQILPTDPVAAVPANPVPSTAPANPVPSTAPAKSAPKAPSKSAPKAPVDTTPDDSNYNDDAPLDDDTSDDAPADEEVKPKTTKKKSTAKGKEEEPSDYSMDEGDAPVKPKNKKRSGKGEDQPSDAGSDYSMDEGGDDAPVKAKNKKKSGKEDEASDTSSDYSTEEGDGPVEKKGNQKKKSSNE